MILKKCIVWGILYFSVLSRAKYPALNLKRDWENEEAAPTWDHHQEEQGGQAERDDGENLIEWEVDSINEWDEELEVEEYWNPSAEPWDGEEYTNEELGWGEEGIDEIDCGDAVKDGKDKGYSDEGHDATTSSQTNLPADAYSVEYIEALRKIGVQNVAAGAKGITYSFYTNAGECKAPQDIQNDITKIKHFEVIRIYDVDCDGVGIILRTMGPNQKLFAGIHYPEAVESSVNILSGAIEANGGDWSKIYTVSIGNEMVNFGKASPESLRASVDQAKALLGAKGYGGPVVTTDTLVAVLNNKELCNVGDYIAVNSHPYWDGGVPAQQAGPWLQSQLSMLYDVCERNGKRIFLAETGWPHSGKKFGQHGDPSKDNQLIAVKSIVDTLGKDTILFTTFNDYWKDGGSHDVEKYWGIYED